MPLLSNTTTSITQLKLTLTSIATANLTTLTMPNFRDIARAIRNGALAVGGVLLGIGYVAGAVTVAVATMPPDYNANVNGAPDRNSATTTDEDKDIPVKVHPKRPRPDDSDDAEVTDTKF